MSEVEPLSVGQQLLLQRLMAAHIMTDHQARELFEELSNEMDGAFRSMEHCFGSINKQLTKGFGLEIATVCMSSGDGDENDENNNAKQKFHAIINRHDDDVAKKSFGFSFNLHERALIRLVIGKLVEDGSSDRKTLINLRSDLQEPYKLTLSQAEHCIEVLLEEEWLILGPEENNGRRRRESMQAKVQMGPRAYLELSQVLTNMGMEEDELPQFIFHRA